MLAISLVVGSFLVVGALLLGTMLGWVLREYMMYHHGAELHPEMYDENGNVLPDSLIAFRFENSDDDYED